MFKKKTIDFCINLQIHVTFVLQDLVSIDVDKKGRDQGDMTVLGHVTQRLVCTPDFESLLDNS